MMHLETRLYRGECRCGCGRLLVSRHHVGALPHFATRVKAGGYCEQKPPRPRTATPAPRPRTDIADPGLRRYLEQREVRRMKASAWAIWQEVQR